MSADNLRVLEEAMRRRTIAVISHPDAGKSTLTEAMLLHARAIAEAGAVHGKAGRRSTVTDWMAMEQARGISVSSAALQFGYGDAVINLVDTPGHADFSEDTFRVLAAVDAAIMLVDAAKGLETQTMKLFDVCRSRGIPILTMINKWDRPGRSALALIDEIRERTGLIPSPVTWPVGQAGDFHGLCDVPTGTMLRFHRTAGGARVATSEQLPSAEATELFGDDWTTACEETALLALDGHSYSRPAFLAQRSTPVFFGSAVQNIGVRELLDFVRDQAPPPDARMTRTQRQHPVNSEFTAYVFKVQSNMDPAHRDRLAFARVCSGRFERGMVAYHAQTGRPFPTKYAQQVFGRDRATVDIAWPGDVVGLVNATALSPGDTLYAGDPVEYPGLPRFAPEHFRVAASADSSKHKQFRRGLTQLDEEGVIQVLHSSRRGDAAPILGAVGPMQFEVAAERMRSEYGAPMSLTPLDYAVAYRTTRESAAALAYRPECETVTRTDGVFLALARTAWWMRRIKDEQPALILEPLDGIVDFAPPSRDKAVTQ